MAAHWARVLVVLSAPRTLASYADVIVLNRRKKQNATSRKWAGFKHPLINIPEEILRLLAPFIEDANDILCYRLGFRKYYEGPNLPYYEYCRIPRYHHVCEECYSLDEEERWTRIEAQVVRGEHERRVLAHARPLPEAFLDSEIILGTRRPFKSGKRHTKRDHRRKGKHAKFVQEDGGVRIKAPRIPSDVRPRRGGNDKARKNREPLFMDLIVNS